MRRYVIVILAVVLLAGCSTSGGKSPTGKGRAPTTGAASETVNGEIVLAGTITTRETDRAGATCWTAGNAPMSFGTSQWDYIRKGAQVAVTDASGRTVGLGRLTGGFTQRAGSARNRPPCEFDYTASGVPLGSRFYGVRVGSHLVGQFPASQLVNATIRLP